ncbi:hypothetical protein PHISCL_10256 [Aspergillus sclerotialis]|uniref:Uncharacterized protein n=1 Tax=Aspergillus sclerotialis TaxID=2070753 RepID=A0A3A2Z2X6_9EURO|nr:hypothetical protein PHISCL_10256 [Aspergillus sclerotialis]
MTKWGGSFWALAGLLKAGRPFRIQHGVRLGARLGWNHDDDKARLRDARLAMNEFGLDLEYGEDLVTSLARDRRLADA